ncbi:MAG: hypothetical protein ACPKPY_01355 [Nitrososphaeraceae archaeon]
MLNSRFDFGNIRTFNSYTETLQQITCINLNDQCTEKIENQVTEAQ